MLNQGLNESPTDMERFLQSRSLETGQEQRRRAVFYNMSKKAEVIKFHMDLNVNIGLLPISIDATTS